MYKMSLYSIYDKAAKTYNAPITCVTDDVAIRLLKETLRDMSTIMARYPEDYELVKVAEFLVENGQVVPCLDIVVSDFTKLISLPVPGAAVGAEPPQAAERPEASTSRCPGCDQQIPPADSALSPLSKARKNKK